MQESHSSFLAVAHLPVCLYLDCRYHSYHIIDEHDTRARGAGLPHVGISTVQKAKEGDMVQQLLSKHAERFAISTTRASKAKEFPLYRATALKNVAVRLIG